MVCAKVPEIVAAMTRSCMTPTDNAQRDYINYIFSKYDPYAAVCIAYRAGVIYGKRAERKKRRAV